MYVAEIKSEILSRKKKVKSSSRSFLREKTSSEDLFLFLSLMQRWIDTRSLYLSVLCVALSEVLEMS